MLRWFNTAGPCQLEKHYMLPSLDRLPSLERLINQEGYFVIHAPRQTGKTTAMLTLAQQLTAEGQYAALMGKFSFEYKSIMLLIACGCDRLINLARMTAVVSPSSF